MKVGCEAGWRMRKEAERKQQQRQQERGSQVQQEELHWRELQESQLVERHHKRRCNCASRGGSWGGRGALGEPLPYGWRRAHNLPDSQPANRHHHPIQSGWVHKRGQQRQLEAAKKSGLLDNALNFSALRAPKCMSPKMRCGPKYVCKGACEDTF